MNFDIVTSCVARYCIKANIHGATVVAQRTRRTKVAPVYVGLHSMFALSWPFFENSGDLRLRIDI